MPKDKVYAPHIWKSGPARQENPQLLVVRWMPVQDLTQNMQLASFLHFNKLPSLVF